MPTFEARKVRNVALVWGAELGPAGFKKLVAHFGDVKEILAADRAALIAADPRLTPEQATAISGISQRLDEFRAQLEKLKDEHIDVFCEWDDSYPSLFRGIRNPPPVISVAGRILPEDDPAIALVGTRTATPEGLEMARELGKAFAEAQTTVVSGLAIGCDTAGHHGALSAGGRTIAILGSGIRVIQPRRNLALARDIFRQGAVVSEQPPYAPPTVGRLMARNRLQSALSRGVLVVEARAQGGSMSTARHAVEQGRRLYVVDWLEPKETAEGTRKLLAEEARPVTGPDDVPAIRLALVDHITWVRERASKPSAQPSLFDQ